MSTPFLRFPGVLGNYIQTEFVNRFDADTANLVQGVGSWRLESGGDWTAAPVIVNDTEAFGGKALQTICTATPNQPRLSTGTPGGTLYAVNGSTQYSANYLVKVDRTGNTAFCSLDWYDAGTAFISRSESSPGVPLSPGVYTEIPVTATSPSNAAFCRIRTRLTPAVADTVHNISECILRDGVSQEIIPSILIEQDLEIRVDMAAIDWTPDAVQDVVARWGDGGVNAYMLRLDPAGTLSLITDVGGTQVATSTVAVGKTDGSRALIRATRAASSGDVQFFVDGAQLGATVSGPSGNVRNDGARLTVGGQSDGTGFNPYAGDIWTAEVLDGIDGAVVASMAAIDASRAAVL